MTLTYQRDNRNEREVYCPQCHIYSFRSDDNPQCYTCKVTLIRVGYSIMTGKRLTGGIKKDESSRGIDSADQVLLPE